MRAFVTRVRTRAAVLAVAAALLLGIGTSPGPVQNFVDGIGTSPGPQQALVDGIGTSPGPA